MKKREWIYMSLEDVQTPKPGRICYGPRWWAVNEKSEVMFYGSYGSPQCNQNKQIVERIRPECGVVFLEFAFIPHNCSDYR